MSGWVGGWVGGGRGGRQGSGPEVVVKCCPSTGQDHQGSQLHPGQSGDDTEPDHSAGRCHQTDGGESEFNCGVV